MNEFSDEVRIFVKKLAIFALLFLVGINVNAEFTLKETGFYGVYVIAMPFWTFWNYNKALEIMAEKTHETMEKIRDAVDLKIPVFFTRDYQEADRFKK